MLRSKGKEGKKKSMEGKKTKIDFVAQRYGIYLHRSNIKYYQIKKSHRHSLVSGDFENNKQQDTFFRNKTLFILFDSN
jgi:hypothetical protein